VVKKWYTIILAASAIKKSPRLENRQDGDNSPKLVTLRSFSYAILSRVRIPRVFQINVENELFKEGKASYYEKLNENSDLPKDVFEKERES
jgi:hypothetical protein